MRVLKIDEVKYIVGKEGYRGSLDKEDSPTQHPKAEVLCSNILGDGSLIELVRFYGGSWLHCDYRYLHYTQAEIMGCELPESL